MPLVTESRQTPTATGDGSELFFGRRVDMSGYRVDGDTIVLVRRTYRPDQHVTVRTDAQVTADLLRTYGCPPRH